MEARAKKNGHRSRAAQGRWNMVWLGVGVILLLALVAGFIWLISSPQLLHRE